MNKTKKITQGAMMLAILGALIGIDRLTAYWFTTFVVLIAPIIIIMYSCMQSLKDGVLLSIGVIIISFILGNFEFTYLIYIPVGVITGLGYAYGIKKGFDKRTLLFISCALYIVGEIIAAYVIYPILGFPITQMIEELKLSFDQIKTISGVDYFSVFETAGFDLNSVLVFIYLLSTILMGAMEGLLIHLLSVFLLKRFKIINLGNINIFDIKPNKVIGYISFLSTFALIFKDRITNQAVYSILMALGVVGTMILIYYAYLFLVCYGAFVLKRNIAAFIILLAIFIPTIQTGLTVVGFLYAAGPLRKHLEDKMNMVNHE